MKVTIQKLGIIQKAEFDLKPLTILIGPNNTGKTWLAYVLAGILGHRGWDEYARAYAGGKLSREYPPLDNAIEGVLAEGSATIDLYKFAEEYGEKYFQNVAALARYWMRDFMSTQLAVFDNMEVSIDLTETRVKFLECVKKYSLESNLAKDLLNIHKKQGDRTLYAYTSTQGKEQITKRLPAEGIRELLVRSVTRTLHQSLYPEIRIFPTERTTLVIFPFGDRMLELSGPMIEQDARAVIEPVSIFLNMVSTAFRIGSREVKQREEDARNNPNTIQKYIQLAQILEREILAGGVGFSTLEPASRRDILFQPTQDIALEIPIASSMVKELSPLVLYLRYLAKPGELLIIDEPEMNLHPEAQVKIIEFLPLLINAGLSVLITTHSPYMLDHLSNLIRAAAEYNIAEYNEERQKSIVNLFFLRRADAFISQHDISIYFVDDGGAESILKENGKIDWSTFGDVSDQVARIHYEL